MTDTVRILVIDEAEACDRLRSLLYDQGWEIYGVKSSDDGLHRIKTMAFDIVLINVDVESVDSVKAVQEILSHCGDIRVVLLTTYSSVDKAIQTLRQGAHAYVLKPFALDALVKTIEKALAQKRLIVSERKRAEAELREAKEELDRLVQQKILLLIESNVQLRAELESLKGNACFGAFPETAEEPSFMKDRDLKYTLVNPAMEHVFGLAAEGWVGKTDEDLFGEETARAIREVDQCVLRGEMAEKEQIFPVQGSPTAFYVTRMPLRDASGAVTGLRGTFRDCTQTKCLGRQFQTSQRLESLGTLAGGIAHNFNNLLTGILGTVSLLLMDLDPGDPKYGKLKRVQDYVHSGVDLTRQLLGFARGGKYEVKVVDLNEVAEKTTAVFAQTKKEITIHREWESRLWRVKADPGQIQQVLLNLYVNAWQAMPGGGDLHIKTENLLLDRTYVRPYSVKPGRYVQVTVRDTGIGMDLETQERIFDPFFTTKEKGRGTGLGLSAVYGIVKNHGGFIQVMSEKGQGTTFEILLPAVEENKREIGKEPVVFPGDKRNRTVLLVDDEEMILNVGKDLLLALGYEPLVAKNGEEALQIYRAQNGRIDLVILDMIMPGMSGHETYGRLKQINQTVKVVLSSGYAVNGEAEKMLQNGVSGFIQKPYSMNDLALKLRETLSQDFPDLL